MNPISFKAYDRHCLNLLDEWPVLISLSCDYVKDNCGFMFHEYFVYQFYNPILSYV